MYDIIFIGDKAIHESAWKSNKLRFPMLKNAHNLEHAQKICITKLFWVIWPDVIVKDDFNFDYEVDQWSMDYVHVFNNNETYDGICLVPKTADVTDKELQHRFFRNKKEVNIVASSPAPYDCFEIDSYEEYQYALENSKTEMFWMSSANIAVDKNLIDTYYISHHDKQLRMQNHAFVHRANNEDHYNGLFLCSKHSPLAKKEVEFRFLVNRIEHSIVASSEVQYDVFEIDSYEEYQYALENSKTEMFWMSSANISADIPKLYFTHDNEYDRKRNHAFIHRANGEDLYNGLFLCSKHLPLTKKEVEYRFPVDRKEWNIVGSEPKQYDVFEIDNYKEYLHALENSKTEMFWMSSANITATIPNIYFSHDNEYDRKRNHAFIHRVGERELYNGLFLCSKHLTLTQREVDYRFPVDRKEWNVVGSGPKQYDIFKVDTYEEYLLAHKKSKTEMFWIIPSTVDVDKNFNFDVYFTHDSEYDRRINHVYLNGQYHDGIILCSKKLKVSKREWDFKFIAGKKEHNIIASYPKPYDVVFISYQEPDADQNFENLKKKVPNAKRVHGVKGIHQAHIEAAKLCSTPMIWIVDGDATIVDDFDFDYQVPAWQYNHVHVWRSKNPINGLVYGYGGVKLFPRQLTIEMDTSKPDMTTSISDKFVAVKKVSNITGFNTGEFETWKSAFRECCKLASKVIDRQKDDETERRLKIWCSIGRDKPFGEFAISGARAGMAYGTANKDNTEALKLINDFDWLKEQFDGNL